MSLLDKKLADTHENASTQINVPEEVAAEIIRIGRELIPDEHLAGNGREELIHVTLKYGVRPDVETFRKAVAGHKPFKVTLGKVVAFTDADTDGTPVVVEAHGHGFEELHDAIDTAIGNRPDDFPYTAHITIAYVEPDEAQHYAGSDAFIGIEFVANAATISMFDDDNQVDVKLAASPAVMPEISEVAPQIPQEEDEEEVQRDEPATQEPEEEQPAKPKRQRSPLLQKKQPKPKPYKAPKPPAENRNFKRWFGKSKVKDEDGNPMVVYHGTTHDFEEFDPRHANVENHYGQALYFTSSQEDLRENYATESGPDITSRIDHRTDQIIQEWDDQWDDVKDDIGLGDIEQMPNWSNVPESDYRRVYERAQQEAKKGIAGQTQGMSMPVYLSIQNPVVVQKNGGTQFELNIDEDGTESGNGVDLYNAMNNAAVDYYSADVQEAWGKIIEDGGESFNAWDFEQVVRLSQSFEDNEGNQAAGQFISDVYQNMGFDGIVQDAYGAFGSPRGGKPMQMDYDTKHYILWDPHKIKSAMGNAGKYDPKNPVITAAAKQRVSLDALPGEVKADFCAEMAERLNKIGFRFEHDSDREIDEGDIRVNFFDLVTEPTIAIYDAPVETLYATMKRKNSEVAVKKYVAMLKANPSMQFDPIFVVNGKFYDGGHRLEAYHRAGRKTIPVAEMAPFLTATLEFWQNWFANDLDAKIAAGEKSVGDLGLAKRIMHELMPVLGVQLPEPELKLANAPRAGWLGRDTWRTSYTRGVGEWKWGDNTTIDLQRSIINDENTLRRVIAHELCHHAEALTSLTQKIQEAKATGTGEWAYTNFGRYMRSNGHGPEFRKWAAKFNAKYGADFVTEKSDESYVVEEQELHPYHILLERNYDGTLGYEVSSRMTTQMKKYLDRLGREGGGYEHRITTTNDRDWVGGPLIGSFYHARPKEPEKQKKLEELWSSAKPFEKFVPLPEGTRVVINDPKSVENRKQGIVKSFNGHDYIVAIENYSLVPEVYFSPSEIAKVAGKRSEAVTSMTVGTTDAEFPMPVLIRWEQGMRWRNVLKAVKSIVGDLAERRVPWSDIHIWASLWDSHEAQEQGWEQEKAKGSKVMYDILHNGTFVRVDRNGQPVVLGAEEVVVASHKTPPLSDTQYNNPEIGEETNAYADIPERVRGTYDVPPLSTLAPQLFEKSGAEVTFRTEFRGSHSGQSDITLVAEVGGKPVGYVEYSVYEGKPAVQFVKVTDKRKGYGTALLRKLQAMFPDAEISLGGTTPEGTKFVESLEFHEEPTEHAGKFGELETLTKERDRLQAVADKFYTEENHTEEEKQAFMRQMEHMNTVHDRIWELEQETQHESPSKRLISSAEVEYRIKANRAEAWIGDKCIGWVNFIEVAPNDVKEIWIRMVFVNPEYRRTGIATGMYEKIKEEFPSERLVSSDTTGEGRKFRSKLLERGVLSAKTAVYGEQQNQVQHTDHQAIGLTKTVNSNPFADEMEALKGKDQVELNPSLEDATKGEGQPRAKGEDKVDMAHATKMQQVGSLTPEEEKRKNEEEKGDWLPDYFYEEEPKPKEPERHWLFRKNVVGDKKEKPTKPTAFDQWVAKYPQLDIEPNLEQEEGQEFGDQPVRSDIEERYNENTQWLSSLDFPLEIYRALEVEKGSEINLGSTGVHWTWVENSADAYFGGSSMWARTKKPRNPELVFLRAVVTDPNVIDFEKTLFNNVQNPDENEITLKSGAEVKLVGIMRDDDNDYKPVAQKTVIARMIGPVYHGTDKAFEQYETYHGLYYFTKSKEYAHQFLSQVRPGNMPEGSNIRRAFLKMDKTFDARKLPDEMDVGELWDAIGGEDGQRTISGQITAVFPFWKWLRDFSKPVKKVLQEQGYDSVVQNETLYLNNEGPGAASYVVFDPSQIRWTFGKKPQAAGPVKIDWKKNMFGKFKLTVEYSYHEHGDPTDENDELGESNWNLLVVNAFDTTKKQKGLLGKWVGSVDFVLRQGELESANTEVDKNYRRQGVATAMYQFAEGFTGFKVRPNNTQSNEGHALWQQKGRPFGASLTAAARPFPSSVVQQIVYHGSNEPFTRVDMSKGAQGVFWVTSDKGKIERGESGAVSSKHIHSMYIDIRKPAGWKDYEQKSLGELKRDYDGVILPEKDGSFDAIVFKPRQVRFVKE